MCKVKVSNTPKLANRKVWSCIVLLEKGQKEFIIIPCRIFLKNASSASLISLRVLTRMEQ